MYQIRLLFVCLTEGLDIESLMISVNNNYGQMALRNKNRGRRHKKD